MDINITNTIHHFIPFSELSFEASMEGEVAQDLKRAEVAIIASPTLGNLVPAVEFAKQLINQRPGRISVSILVISMPQRPLINDYVQSHPSTQQIRFIHLHPAHSPHPHQYNSSIEFMSLYIENHKSIIKQTLKTLMTAGSDSVLVPLAGLFVDMFCTPMIDVANDLNIPSYLFFASPAAYLGFVLHLTTLPATESVHSMTELAVPSYANPVPSDAFPSFCTNKNDFGYSTFVAHSYRYKETKGIIINTFQDLESYALDSLSSDYIDLPLVYPVGPIIDHVGPAKWHSNRSGHENIISWLDLQPSSSVIFLCFGSMGSLNRAQIREIATGLEGSGYRFLWALRAPAKTKLELPNDYELEEDLFPDGFIDRTAGVGLTCGWVSQVSVLAHRAIGGFVSHCGWNSILESIWYDVPIATWPLYAEQQLNAFEMVKDLGVSVEIRLGSRVWGGDVVSADEVERGVRKVMEGGDDGWRRKVKEMSEKGKKGLMENGSSFKALEKLIDIFLSNI